MSFQESHSAYSHLMDVNKQWIHYKDQVPTNTKTFDSEKERIQFHLEQVINVLRSKSSLPLPQQTLENRTFLINQLEGYAKNGKFPTNSNHIERTPYFIDKEGVHCAVGYLIERSGSGALALEISKTYNYNYIADIKTEGILSWATQNGFSLKELAFIQPTYEFKKIELLVDPPYIPWDAKASALASRHLYEINKSWGSVVEIPTNTIQFKSENERIQFHLTQAIKVLKSKSELPYSAQIVKKRMNLLRQLEQYSKRGEFPTLNLIGRQIEQTNHKKNIMGAVEYIIMKSGSKDLAQKTKEAREKKRVEKIENPTMDEIKAWAKQNGFSIKELSLIQLPLHSNM